MKVLHDEWSDSTTDIGCLGMIWIIRNKNCIAFSFFFVEVSNKVNQYTNPCALPRVKGFAY